MNSLMIFIFVGGMLCGACIMWLGDYILSPIKKYKYNYATGRLDLLLQRKDRARRWVTTNVEIAGLGMSEKAENSEE